MVQSRDDCVRGINERVITIIGSENSVLQAVGRILKKCLEDPAFEEYRTQSLSHTGAIAGLQVSPAVLSWPVMISTCWITTRLSLAISSGRYAVACDPAIMTL
jgi:hypothetical protein